MTDHGPGSPSRGTAEMQAVGPDGVVVGVDVTQAMLDEAGRLALFHPVGRVELARRRGHELRADDPRAPERLACVLSAWCTACVSRGAGSRDALRW